LKIKILENAERAQDEDLFGSSSGSGEGEWLKLDKYQQRATNVVRTEKEDEIEDEIEEEGEEEEEEEEEESTRDRDRIPLFGGWKPPRKSKYESDCDDFDDPDGQERLRDCARCTHSRNWCACPKYIPLPPKIDGKRQGRIVREGQGSYESWYLGICSDSRSRHAKVIELLEQSLAIFKEVGDRAGQAKTYNNLADCYDVRQPGSLLSVARSSRQGDRADRAVFGHF
jgi:hypothetical protein